MSFSYSDYISPFNSYISSTSRDIVAVSKSIVNNEKHKMSRILYCGPNFSSNSGMALYRLVEVKYGDFFVEKVIFNQDKIDSTFIRVPSEKFNRNQTSQQEYANRLGNLGKAMLSSTTHYRNTPEGVLKTFSINDNRDRSSFLFLSDFYLYWKLRIMSKK